MGLENERVKFLDVGHGDSSVIYLKGKQSGNESVIIIDIADAEKLLEELNSNHVNVIDWLILSHTDEDHCRGVNSFIEKYIQKGKIERICYNFDREKLTKHMRLFRTKFRELYKGNRIHLEPGEFSTSENYIKLISNRKANFIMLYPNKAELDEALEKHSTNNASIVCLLETNTCRILFSGDLEEDGWRSLLRRMPDLKCDVLKMPHHGAFYDGKKGIGLTEILDVLNPRDAIISSRNHEGYRHPDQRTIDLLKDKQIQIYCTEYTKLCNCDIGKYDKKCYGCIEVAATDFGYEIKTETDNRPLFDHAACSG